MISCIIKKYRLSKSEKFDHRYLNPLKLGCYYANKHKL